MLSANNPQVQTPPAPGGGPIPWTPTKSPLEAWIDQWKKDGVSLELIVMFCMFNPMGTGAGDAVSDSIAGITKQSNILSQVQSDIITLNSILSKIESQMDKSKVGEQTWDQFNKSNPNLLKQFQSTYNKLFKSNTANPGGESDIDLLASYQAKYPSLKPAVDTVKNWQGDFNTNLNGDKVSFQSNLQDHFSSKWDPTNGFVKDICFLAQQHYAATHTNNNGGGNQPDATDTLQDWWTSGNEGQSLTGEQSQEDSTQIQSFMQLLQGFDSAGQQMIQLASTQKSQMIQNEKTS